MKPRTLAVVAATALAVLIVGFLVWRFPGGTTATTTETATTPRATAATTRPATGPTQPTATLDPETGLPWIDVSRLPSQAREMLTLIDKGGPYRYSQDGSTFGNNERILPQKPRGFYKEYTVKLPSSPDRGPTRIVVGGSWYFYTDDHYASFSRIRR